MQEADLLSLSPSRYRIVEQRLSNLLPIVQPVNQSKTASAFAKNFRRAVLASDLENSWVIKTLDGDELDHLQPVNFQALSCRMKPRGRSSRHGKCGLSVRFVQLSRDGRYCQLQPPAPRHLPIASPLARRTDEPAANPSRPSSIFPRRVFSNPSGCASSPGLSSSGRVMLSRSSL